VVTGEAEEAAATQLGRGARIGFVGLGNMGQPMVRRLVSAGFSVQGYDLAPDARAALDQVTGASAVQQLVDVAEGADVVILMLPDSRAVQEVLIGSGLLQAMAPGTVLVDMGSSEPARTRTLAGQAAERGIPMIDAPVSGGVRGAVAGTLTIMVGGPDETLARVRPVLEAMGGRVLHAGEVGAGDAVKALNNLMSAAHLLASSEAILAGTAFGLDPEVILDIVNGSTGRSWSTQTKWPDYVLSGAYNSGFGMRLMLKDMRIALELAKEAKTPARLAEAAVQLWSEAVDASAPTADHTEIVRWLEQESPDAPRFGGAST
jgi:3-hydroxyisobutyrate dehydrogenase